MRFDFAGSPLILVVGPTAVGKTGFAIELAQKIGGEIISADSRSFYRGMDIGTAKPSKKEQEKVPHYLVDIADPDEMISLPLFLRMAHDAAEQIYRRKRIPILVGGTGQYIRSILEGWQVPEGEPHPRMREVLEEMARESGPLELHRKLAIIDPVTAREIDPANVRRTVRALEVIFSSGRKFSEQRIRTGCQYSTIEIGLTRPRKDLYERADQRIEKMVAHGLESETRGLMEAGYSLDLPSFSAIGYREIGMVIRNEITQTEAIARMKRRTRVFIRRQAAWFRMDDPNIHWFTPEGDALERVVKLVECRDFWNILP